MTSPTLVARNWRELIRPRNVPVDQESLSDTYGKFVVEPLERGFGITLGNSLRRVLLTLQGAAITAVKIDGALHEFTSVPDVVEDVTEMVLNFKEVVVRSHTARTQTVRIEKEGPGIVTASDIQVSDQIEILNPDHKICTLAKGGRFAAELTINVGHGYVPADRNKTAGIPIGTIAIDIPIRRTLRIEVSLEESRGLIPNIVVDSQRMAARLIRSVTDRDFAHANGVGQAIGDVAESHEVTKMEKPACPSLGVFFTPSATGDVTVFVDATLLFENRITHVG